MLETYAADEYLWYYLRSLCTIVVVWLCFSRLSEELSAICWARLMMYICLWPALRDWWSYFNRNPFALSQLPPTSVDLSLHSCTFVAVKIHMMGTKVFLLLYHCFCPASSQPSSLLWLFFHSFPLCLHWLPSHHFPPHFLGFTALTWFSWLLSALRMLLSFWNI